MRVAFPPSLAAMLTWYSLRAERALLLDELRLRHTAQTDYWIQNNLTSLISPDPAALKPLTHELQASGDVAYIVMYDAQGKVLLVSGPESAAVVMREVKPQQLDEHNALFDTMTGTGGRFYELTLPILLPQGSASGTSAAISAMPGLMPAAAPEPAKPEVLGAIRLGISAMSVNAKMMSIRNDSIRLAAAMLTAKSGTP